jgi:hypothetical protein
MQAWIRSGGFIHICLSSVFYNIDAGENAGFTRMFFLLI